MSFTFVVCGAAVAVLEEFEAHIFAVFGGVDALVDNSAVSEYEKQAVSDKLAAAVAAAAASDGNLADRGMNAVSALQKNVCA